MNKAVYQALQKVGNEGRYQTILGVLLFFAACEVNLLIVGPTFIYMNPTFNCSFVEGPIEESIACPRMNQCSIKHQFTITAALQLYCDKQFTRNTIQSIPALGAVIGLLFLNYISDTRGRKIGLIIPQFIAILSVILTLLGGWIESIPIIIASQFFAGMSSFGLIGSAYIIPAQFCQNNLREKLTVQVNYALAVTTILIGVLYFYYNIWYKYLIVFLIIPFILLLIATFYFMVESPYFLHQEGRWQEYAESLKIIASYNQRQRYFNAVEILKAGKEYIPQAEEQLSYTQVIFNPFYLKVIVIFSLANIGIQVYFQGRIFTLDMAGWQYGYNCILTGVTQFIAYIILGLMVNFMPRKKGFIISTCILIASGLIFLIQPIVEDKLIQMIFFCINCAIGTFVYTVALLYATQSLPSKISATGFGIIDAVGQIGFLMAPFIVTYCNNHQIYPMIIIAGLQFIFLLIPILFLDDSHYHRHIQEQGFEIEEEKPTK